MLSLGAWTGGLITGSTKFCSMWNGVITLCSGGHRGSTVIVSGKWGGGTLWVSVYVCSVCAESGSFDSCRIPTVWMFCSI